MAKKELELYELVLLFKFSTMEADTGKLINSYQKFITSSGSQVIIKNQGKKSLAYPIKRFEVATAVQIFFLGNGDLIKQINTQIQRDNAVFWIDHYKISQ